MDYYYKNKTVTFSLNLTINIILNLRITMVNVILFSKEALFKKLEQIFVNFSFLNFFLIYYFNNILVFFTKIPKLIMKIILRFKIGLYEI